MSFRYKPRSWSVALLFGVVASLCTVGTAQAQAGPPAITTPEANGRLSIGTDDLDPDTAGFQLQIAGTADAGAEVTVEVKRPDGEYAAFGTDTAEGGNWSVEETLDPGQWVARARTGEGEEQATSAEVPFAVTLRYVFTFYDSVNSQLRNWVLAANPNDTTAKVEIHVAGVPRATVDVAAGAAQARRFADLAAGPVEVFSLDGVPLVTTQRTLWTNDDFEEVAGVYDGYLTNEAWFSWYDAVGTNARDWIVVTNMGTATTQVTVTVAGEVLAQPRDIAPGGSSAFREAGVRGGPVRVTASNNQPVLASRRTLWTPQNFVELPSIPDRWLEADYTFPWYDSVGTGDQTWIMVAAPTSTVGDTEVSIVPPAEEAGAVAFVLEPGEVVAHRFAGTRGGPVFVSADQPVIATQRALWANGQSFEEVNGIQNAEITDVYHQTFYDTKNTGGRDWLLQASVIPPGTENGDVAYSITCPTIDHSSTLAPGEVEAPRFGDKAEGPCVIDGDGPFVQSRRTLWGTKGDFTELSGIRGSALSGAADQAAAPGSVTVTDVPNDDGTNLDVSWAPVDDASVDGYWVYREQSPLRRVAFLPASACGESSCGPVRDSGLDYETEARYRVVALSVATVEGIPALGAGTPIDNPPTAPTWPEEGAVVPGDAEVALDWNDNPEPDVTGYNVYFTEDPQQDPFPSACNQSVGGPAEGDYTKHNEAPIAESTYTVTGLTNDTRYCFQVTALDNSDEGESARSEARDGTPGQMPPTVAVDSPEDGSVLEGGTTHTIAYTAEDPNQDIESATVEYTLDSTADTVVWNVIEGCEEPDGTCEWSIPEADTQNAQVRVTVTDSKENTATDTTGDFAIDSSPPDVNVTAPTSEDSFQGGDTITIEWVSNEPNPADGGVDIHWTTNGTTFQEADGCQDTADDGSCDWTAPTIDSNTVQVRVTVTDEVGHTDDGISEQFTIATPPAAPTGLTATPGDEQVFLDWNDNSEPDLAGYNVYRAQPGALETCDSATYSQINAALVEMSEYTDTGLTNDTEYCYRVSAEDQTGTEGPQSGSASATPGAMPPNVTVLEPSAGDVLRGDGTTTYEIAWEDTDPNEDFAFVRIEYSTNASASQQEGGPTWVTEEPATDNDGSYMWDPPTSDSNDVQIRITATDEKGNTDQATSETFALDSTFPVVSNVTVSGGNGAPFKGGENVDITWETTEANPDHADIEYSTDGGATWQPIASCTDIEDDGSCTWTLPNLNSEQVRVRVTHTDAVGHTGSGQSSNFTVDSIAPNAPSILTIEEQTPPAVGNDTTPQVVVSLTTNEGGQVLIYVNGNPVCGAGTPAATKAVPAGDTQVTFNPTEDDEELTVSSEGNNNIYACHQDPAGNDSSRSTAARYTLDTQAPPPPSNVEASDAPGNEGVLVTWTGVNDNGQAGLAGYNVYRLENPVGGVCPPGDTPDAYTVKANDEGLVPAGTESFTDDAVVNGTNYCYAVSAVDNAGNEGDKTATVTPATPTSD